MCETFTQQILQFCVYYPYLSFGNGHVTPDIHSMGKKENESPGAVLSLIELIEMIGISQEMSQTTRECLVSIIWLEATLNQQYLRLFFSCYGNNISAVTSARGYL